MVNSNSRLGGKCALVTGATAGNGKGIAFKLAAEGANVAINYRESDDGARQIVQTLEDNLGIDALPVKADVSKAQDVDIMIDAVVAHFGRLDILVNNAGIVIEADLAETTESMWDKVIDTNLKGPFLCSKRAVPEILKQGKGKIINIASIDSFVAEPKILAYCASKAGVVGLTKALALELAPKKINVNAIAPGQIRSRMTEEMMKNPEVVKSWLAMTPYGRVGTPEDISAVAAFLASDESEFINGEVIVVDGGWLIQ